MNDGHSRSVAKRAEDFSLTFETVKGWFFSNGHTIRFKQFAKYANVIYRLAYPSGRLIKPAFGFPADPHEQQHQRNFDENPDDRRQCRPGRQPEQHRRRGDGDFKVVGRPDEGTWRSAYGQNTQPDLETLLFQHRTTASDAPSQPTSPPANPVPP